MEVLHHSEIGLLGMLIFAMQEAMPACASAQQAAGKLQAQLAEGPPGEVGADMDAGPVVEDAVLRRRTDGEGLDLVGGLDARRHLGELLPAEAVERDGVPHELRDLPSGVPGEGGLK